MNPDCGQLNPLQRDGTSQFQRLVRALHPSYVEVDERELSDLLLYAREYARLIRFYSSQNNSSGDWSKFIEADVTTLVAIVAKADLEPQRIAIEEASDLTDLVSPTIQLIGRAYEWYGRAKKGLSLHALLDRTINSVLKEELVNIVAYGYRLQELGAALADEELSTPFLGQNPALLSGVQADRSLFPSGNLANDSEAEPAEQRMRRSFQNAYEAIVAIVRQAPQLLEQTLNEYPQHQPHAALFLAFLQLFRIAQRDMNTITKRHLDFYYQDVLQVALKPEVPDEVHMVFELAKQFSSHLVAEDTLLKGPKDENQATVLFGLDSDLVVNKTQLYEAGGLRTVFLKKTYDSALPGPSTPYTIENIYAAPFANSLDGFGEEALPDGEKWASFGNASLPYARVGFAIASPLLLLQEGRRVINITFELDNSAGEDFGEGDDTNHPIANELRHNIKLRYSGEEGWVEASITAVAFSLVASEETGSLAFTIELPPESPPCLPYVAGDLPPGYATEEPIFEFVLDNEGLSAGYIDFEPEYLANESEATIKIPAFLQRRILAFFNRPAGEDDWAEIAGVEPQDGPVFDNTDFFVNPSENPDPDYDLGEVVARRILQMRDTDFGGRYTSLNQLASVPGVGVDKLNDLFYTFYVLSVLEDNISALKARATNYRSDRSYELGDIVIWNGEYYRALASVQNIAPSAASDFWEWLPRSYPYKYLQSMPVTAMDLTVHVEDLRSLILENDFGQLNPAKPFLPFGTQPKKGSAFYVGSAEVFSKPLSELNVEVAWADLPEENFRAHYNEYRTTDSSGVLNGTIPVSGNAHFTAEVELLQNGEWSSSGLAEDVWTLFEPENAISDPSEEKVYSSSISGLELAGQREPFDRLQLDLKRGFLRFVLQQSFLHKEYPRWIASAALASANNASLIPNEPYTPTISGLSLSYTASTREVYDTLPYPDRQSHLFHLTPFGWQAFYPGPEKVDLEAAVIRDLLVPLFPQGAEGGARDAEGHLYVGLTGLEPEQQVSILFQVAEGSDDPTLQKQELQWSYLSHNRWMDFKRTQLLSDTTNGLLNPGIITFTMPKAMTDQHTRMPAGVYWIRASVGQQTRAVSDLIAVMPQAVKASFRKARANDLNRLADPLPAEEIGKLNARRAAIKSVLQPFASFNGQLKEQNTVPEGVTGEDRFMPQYNEYYIRVSERLRHKRRAVTIWDYERLVLQQFPDIYKVKCLNHTQIAKEGQLASEQAPGHVKVIVLPNLRNKNAVDPLRPMASLSQLEAIKAYLNPLKSDFATLEVRNPLFEQVQVAFNVQLMPGRDKGFFTQQLQTDILRFLSPWLYDDGAGLELGGRVHRSVILNHVEEREYVDFVTDFKLHHFIPGQAARLDVEEARATTSSSVIVSVPAEQHLINPDLSIACLNELSS
jgi:hypothetical protein